MTRKLISLLLALATLVLCMAPMAALAEEKAAWCKMPNAGGSLHLRAWPGKIFDSVGYVQDGDALTVYTDQTGTDSESETWIKVKVARTGKTGYIKTKYISYTAPSGTSSSTQSKTTIWVSANGGSLNVRKGPATSYARAGYVQHGDAVTVLEKGSVWSKIKVVRTGVVGYVKTRYIAGAASIPTTPAQPSAPSVSGDYRLATVTTKTTKGVVNLRSGAGTGYKSIGKVGRGDQLSVYDTNGNWHLVKTEDGKTGYIYSTYVAFGVTGRTTAGVNFRTGAGTGFGVITTIPKGAAVTVHGVTGNWANVSYNGRTGYVYSTYVKF